MGIINRFEENEDVIVIAATNFPNSLDPAVVRPGRFDKKITIPKPTSEVRKKMFQYYLTKLQIPKYQIDLRKLSSLTIDMTGADIKNIVNISGLSIVKKGKNRIEQNDMIAAYERVKMGLKRDKAGISQKELLKTAYHEAGHAIIALLTTGASKLHKVTIMPIGGSLGHNGFLPLDYTENLTDINMKANLDTALGGRVAEELIYGKEKITSGCSGDLNSLSSTAYAMNTYLGMNNYLIPIFSGDKKISDETIDEIDLKTQEVVSESLIRVKKLLSNNIEKLHLLAKKLIEVETMTGEDVKKLLNL